MSEKPSPSPSANSLVLSERVSVGDIVVIEDQGVRHEATVGSVAPRGDFSVHWYAGRNQFAPHLPGHWFCEFGPKGEPRQKWRIVEYRKKGT